MPEVLLQGYESGSTDDESNSAHIFTAVGGAVADATRAKFGTGSLQLGASQGLYKAAIPSIINGSEPFTIEVWDYCVSGASTSRVIAGQNYDATLLWEFRTFNNTRLRLGIGEAGGDQLIYTPTSGFTLTTGAWHHIACDFDGTTYRFYFNGAMIYSQVSTFTIKSGSAPLTVGCIANSPDGSTVWQTGGVHSFDELRVIAGEAVYASDSGFTVPSAAFDRPPPPPPADAPFEETVAEGVSFDDGFSHTATGQLYLSTTSTSMTVAETSGALRNILVSVNEGVRTFAFSAGARGIAAAASDTVTMTPAPLGAVAWAAIEQLRLGDSLSRTWRHGATLSENLRLLERINATELATAAEQLDLSAVLSAAAAARVVEQLGLTTAVAPSARYGLTVAESLRLADSLANFFAAEAIESLSLSESISTLQRLRASAAEAVALTDDVAPTLVIRETVAETMEFSDLLTPKAIYTALAAETLQVEIAFVNPGGGVATWVMNASTGAVSEYDNYAFNSFADYGNQYVAASSQGLYRLDGDTDDGDDIIANLKGGYIQFGGTRLSRLKAAYVALRGGGDVILRLVTGDDSVYNYRVTTQNMKTTKVNMGKGQRARYFAYELETTGQDFELDTLEFVPVVVQRRV